MFLRSSAFSTNHLPDKFSNNEIFKEPGKVLRQSINVTNLGFDVSIENESILSAIWNKEVMISLFNIAMKTYVFFEEATYFFKLTVNVSSKFLNVSRIL